MFSQPPNSMSSKNTKEITITIILELNVRNSSKHRFFFHRDPMTEPRGSDT